MVWNDKLFTTIKGKSLTIYTHEHKKGGGKVIERIKFNN